MQFKLTRKEIIPLVATLFGIGYFAIHYAALPDIVPIHFGITGKPDGFAPKPSAILLPVLAVWMYGMLLLGDASQKFNIPWQVTDTNREESICLARQLLYNVRLIICVLLGYLQFALVETALRRMDGLGIWFAPVFIGGIFIPIIVFFIKGRSLKA